MLPEEPATMDLNDVACHPGFALLPALLDRRETKVEATGLRATPDLALKASRIESTSA